jgi:integrase
MTSNVSARNIERLTVGRHSFGHSLYLVVKPSGRKAWVFRYQRKTRHDLGLGPYPLVSLTEARLAARDAQLLLAQGKDPIAERQSAQREKVVVPTFGGVAARVLDDVASKALNPKSVARAKLLLGESYCASFMTRPVNTITTVEVADLLKSVVAQKPETAKKLHSALSKVFEAARVLLKDDPETAITRLPTDLKDLKALGYEIRVQHQAFPALDWRQAPEFTVTLHHHHGLAYRALELAMLTGLREAAVTGAEWPEIDFDQGVWTIPLNRLKDRRHRTKPLRVPLSTRSIQILEGLRGLSSRWVFPGQRPHKPLAPQSLLQALKLTLNRDATGKPRWIDPDSRRPIVVHGFRATLKTFGEDHGFRHEVTELTLGHALGGEVERSYRRTDLLEERRTFLQAWADHCQGNVAQNVIRLRA